MTRLSQWLTNRLIGVRLAGEKDDPFYQSRILGVRGQVLMVTLPYLKNKGLWPGPGTRLAITLDPPDQGTAVPPSAAGGPATGSGGPSETPSLETRSTIPAAPGSPIPGSPGTASASSTLTPDQAAQASGKDGDRRTNSPHPGGTPTRAPNTAETAGSPEPFLAEVVERHLKPIPSLVLRIRQDLPLLKALSGRRHCRTLAITSGKGGTGKTLLSANLAVILASHGFRVTLVDADLGTANVAVTLGLKPQADLWSVIDGRRTLEEIQLEGPAGITVIPGGSGLQELANLTQWQFGKLLGALSALESRSDLLLIDTGAGISQNVAAFLRIVREVVLVTHLEPAALLDAYAVIKTMASQQMRPRFSFLYNRVTAPPEVEASFSNFQATAQQFLKTPVEFLGFLPEDPNVLRSVRQQRPIVLTYPRSPASKSLAQIAESLVVSGFGIQESPF